MEKKGVISITVLLQDRAAVVIIKADPSQSGEAAAGDAGAHDRVLALFFPVPMLSALMGAVAMWRTRTFHMKGFGLAVAAVVINVLYTIAVIWMAFNAMTP